MRSKSLHVAVGVIQKGREVLIARRQKGQHLEGFWEFPGGKLEAGEDAQVALARELKEELSIAVIDSHFLFDVTYDYPEKRVTLSIFLVNTFTGEPVGVEGQPLSWCDIDKLQSYTFPPANQAIIQYLLKSP